jgi:hypothetical protein
MGEGGESRRKKEKFALKNILAGVRYNENLLGYQRGGEGHNYLAEANIRSLTKKGKGDDFVGKGIYENGRFGDIKLAKDKNLFLQQPGNDNDLSVKKKK